MNICLIDPNFFKKNHAGITTYNFYLAKGLTAYGHEVHIICEDGPDKQKIKSSKLILHIVPTKTGPRTRSVLSGRSVRKLGKKCLFKGERKKRP